MHEPILNGPGPPATAETTKPGQPLLLLLLVAVVVICIALFGGRQRPAARFRGNPATGEVARDDGKSPGQQSDRFAGTSLTRFAAAVPGDDKILRALKKKVDLDWTGLALEDAMHDVARQLDVPLELDRAALAEEGIALDQPVTFHLRGITGRSALNLLLLPILEWFVADEVLRVTVGFRSAETRVYDVADLVAIRDDTGAPAADFAFLIDIVTATIAPDSWDVNDGSGSMRELRTGGVNALVILQTQQVHEQIAALLANLRSRRPVHAETIQSKSPVRKHEYRPRHSVNRFGPLVDPQSIAVARGNNLFAIDLYSRLAKETDGNLLVSPISLSYAMALVYAGARGKTAAEIARTLHFLVPQQNLPHALDAIWPPLNLGGFVLPGHAWWMYLSGRGGQMGVFSLMWIQNGIEPAGPFDKRTNQSNVWYRHVDFSDRAGAALSIGEAIPRTVRAEDLGEKTRCLVTNANSFHGVWSLSFDAQQTSKSKFAAGTSQSDVAMMHIETDFFCRYAAGDGFEILEKPYLDGTVSMVILLPAGTPGALVALESNLTEVNLLRWLAMLASQRPEVFLPRFSLASETRLRNTLEALGMKQAFQDGADLSDMFHTAGINVDEVLHWANIEVDEQGPRDSKPALARHTIRDADNEAHPVFRADRPFIFLIRDNTNGSILFIGRLVKPVAPPE